MTYDEISGNAKTELLKELKTAIKTILTNKPHWKRKIESGDIVSIRDTVPKILSTLGVDYQSEIDRLLQNRKSDNSVSQFRSKLTRQFSMWAGDLEDFIEDELKPIRERKQNEYREATEEYKSKYENDYDYLFDWTEYKIIEELIRYEVLTKVLGGSLNSYGTEFESQLMPEEYYELFGLKRTVFETKDIQPEDSNIEDQKVPPQPSEQIGVSITEPMKVILNRESDWERIYQFMLDKKWLILMKNGKLRRDDKFQKSDTHLTDFIYNLHQREYFQSRYVKAFSICEYFMSEIEGYIVKEGTLAPSRRMKSESHDWFREFEEKFPNLKSIRTS